MQMVARSTTNIRWSEMWCFLYLVRLPFLAMTSAHLSGIVSIFFLRTSTLMLSHAFCNSSQWLFFQCRIDLSSLFSDSPQICLMGLRSELWGGQSISFKIPADFSIVCSSSNSSARVLNPLKYAKCSNNFGHNHKTKATVKMWPKYFCFFFSAVKQFIASKIKVFVYIMCVCTLYIYYVYINTHTCMYIFVQNMLSLYILNIWLLSQSPVELHCISQHPSCHSPAFRQYSLTPDLHQGILLTCCY